ncbi:MAG: hypothetical protein WC635_12390 [Bacteriovorax sp.]|jgi:hypothetical protein
MKFEEKFEIFLKTPFNTDWKAFYISLCLTVFILIPLQYLVVYLGVHDLIPYPFWLKFALGVPIGGSDYPQMIGDASRDFRFFFVDEILIYYLMLSGFILFRKRSTAIVENNKSEIFNKVLILIFSYSLFVFPHMRNRKMIYNVLNSREVKELEKFCPVESTQGYEGNKIMYCMPDENSSDKFVNQLVLYKLIHRE